MMMLRKNLIFLLICIYFKYSKLQYASAESVPDLYSPNDYVIRLNSTSFVPTVFHQNKNITYMVQFYNTFCGHCQMFAPVYKDLASRIRNWTSVIRIAGVDCAKDINVITCSENKIEGYPTILIFPPNARVQDPKDKPLSLRSLNIDWNVDDIEETLVDYVANLSTTRSEYPLVVKALQPIHATDLKYVNRVYPKVTDDNAAISEPQDLQDLMFIVETEKSYLGRKLIIEYFRIQHKLELRRIMVSNKAILKSMMQQDDFNRLDSDQPILLRLKSGDNIAQVLVRGEADHILPTSADHERQDFIHERFKNFFDLFYSIELLEDGNLQNSLFAPSKSTAPTNSNSVDQDPYNELEFQYLLNSDPAINKRVFATDILKGISYMITHEIKIKGDLSPFEFNVVRNILTIFKKYLPLDKWDPKVSKFIEELRTRLDSERIEYEKNGLTGQKFSDLLELSGAETIRLKYNRERWVSCMESDRTHKGYTCSLWLLFHSLTVGEYIKAAPVRVNPKMVLFTMRDYIINFLGCTTCSLNFKKETETLEHSLNNRNSSIIWLWLTHNHINWRLNNERLITDRKPLDEVVFPPPKLCPSCLLTNLNTLRSEASTLEDTVWDQNAVLTYLLDNYRPERIISPKDTASLLTAFKNKAKYNLVESDTQSGRRRISTVGADMNQSEKWNLHSMITTSDISLCLFLYLACILIVAIVYVALNPKWRRFKTK